MHEQVIHIDKKIAGYNYNPENLEDEVFKIYTHRETHMIEAANRAVQNKVTAIWKVGELHVQNMLDPENPNYKAEKNFLILSREDFNKELRLFEKTKELRNKKPIKTTKQNKARRNSI